MKFHVNDECIGCGMCASICPEEFEMTDAGVAKASHLDIVAEILPEAEEAKNACPVGAIEAEL